MLDVVVERVTERDHFDERREEHEEERHRIAPNADELFEQDRAQAAEGTMFHRGENAVIPSEARDLANGRKVAVTNQSNAGSWLPRVRSFSRDASL